MNEITKGLEDYLESIYTHLQSNECLKAIDIANKFNISRSATSEALIRLADLDLIIYKGRQGIKITQKGIQEAKKIIKKHQILSKFFNEIIGVSRELSDKNACKIEHVIDDELIEKIKEYTESHTNKNEQY